MDKLMSIAQEWLSGSAKVQACGYGPNGPNVQLKRPNGEVVLLELREVAEAWVQSYKHTTHNWDQEMYEQMLPDSLKSTKTNNNKG